MEAETKLINKFYEGFWITLACSIILTVLVVIFIALRNKIIGIEGDKKKIIIIGVSLVLIGFNIFFAIKFIPYCQDLQSIRNKDFKVYSGTVINYGKKETIGDLIHETIYSFPIIQDDENNQIKLKVNETKINNYYTFIYLEHTKLAVIVDSHEG
jgi:hypothetical protein